MKLIMARKIALTTLMVISSGTGVQAFEYDQKIIGFGDELVATVNSCGVYSSPTGTYLRGGYQSVRVDVGNDDLLKMTSSGEGLISAFLNDSSKEVTLYLNSSSSNLKERELTSFDPILFDLGVLDLSVDVPVVIRSITSDGDKALVVVTEIVSANEESTTIYLISNVKGAPTLSVIETNSDVEFVSWTGNELYIQDSNGRTYKLDSISDMEQRVSTETYLQTTGVIDSITEFNGELIVLYDNNEVYLADSGDVLRGGLNKRIYSGANDITSITSYRTTFIPILVGEIPIFIPQDGAILTAFSNGRVVSARNTSDIISGATNLIVHGAVSTNRLKSDFIVLSGNQNNLDDIDAVILDRDLTHELDDRFFVTSSASVYATGYVTSLSGVDATVQLEDKGWDGWEYVWRDIGYFTGLFDVEANNSLIGKTSLRVTAHDDCIIMISITSKDMELFTFGSHQDFGSFIFGNFKTYFKTKYLNSQYNIF